MEFPSFSMAKHCGLRLVVTSDFDQPLFPQACTSHTAHNADGSTYIFLEEEQSDYSMDDHLNKDKEMDVVLATPTGRDSTGIAHQPPPIAAKKEFDGMDTTPSPQQPPSPAIDKERHYNFRSDPAQTSKSVKRFCADSFDDPDLIPKRREVRHQLESEESDFGFDVAIELADEETKDLTRSTGNRWGREQGTRRGRDHAQCQKRTN